MPGSAADSATVAIDGDRAIVVTRKLAAPRRLAWDLHHDPVHVRRWWGVRGVDNHITEIDLRPGGEWRFGQRADDGTEVVFSGRYVEIVEPEHFSYTKGWPRFTGREASDEVPDSVITISFAEESTERTIVTLRCDFASAELRDAVVRSGLDRLQRSYDRMDDLIGSLS